MNPSPSSSSCPQVLRQLLSFDLPKLSLVKCDDEQKGWIRTSSSSSRSGGGDTEKQKGRLTTSASPCVICSTQVQDNGDQVFIFSSDDHHHRLILTSLLGGSSSDEAGWSLCPSCLSIVRRLTRLMDEVEDIKAKIKAVIKLAMTTAVGSTFVEKPEGPAATHVDVVTSLITTEPLPGSPHHDNDDHPVDVQDDPMKYHDDDVEGDDEDTISDAMTFLKDEPMIADDGSNDHHEEGPSTMPLVITTEAASNEGYRDEDPSPLSTGDPNPTMRVLRCHSLGSQEEAKAANVSDVPLLSDQATTFDEKPTHVSHLKRVRRRILKDHAYKGPLCPNKTFKTSAKYRKRREDVHNKRRSPPCYFCQKTLYHRYLVDHIRIHTLERPYLCSDCGLDFTSSMCLKKHECPKNPCDYQPKPTLECHLCGKTFQGSSGLRRHTRRAHKATKKMDFQPFRGPKGYLCPECGKTFTVKNSLTYHLQAVHLLDPSKRQNCPICPSQFYTEHVSLAHTHPDPKDSSNVLYICSICRKTFMTRTGYQYHWSTAHNVKTDIYNKRRSPPCYFCQKTLYHRYLVDHIRIHTLERPYLCSDCGLDFTSSMCLKQHECPKNPCVYPPKPKLECHICGKTFQYRSGLDRHTRRAHKAKATKMDFQPFRGPKGYACPECDKTFTLKKSLTSHLRAAHLLDPSKKQNCPICPFQFYTEHVSLAHTHPDPKDSSNVIYICSICRKTFMTRTGYQYHWSTAHNDKTDIHNKRRSYPCYFCQKTVYHRNLFHHLRSHTLERPYLCSDCGQDFITSLALKQHECPKNPSVYPLKPRLQCHLCGKTFKDSKGLDCHTRTAHNATKMDFQPTAGTSGYRCPQCDKSFAQKGPLTKHMQIAHLLDPSKKQSCPICHNRFNSERVFLAHTHPDPKDPSNVVYICSICKKTFQFKRNYHHHWCVVHNKSSLQCQLCGNVFRAAKTMNHHSKSCSVSPEEQRTCPMPSCSKVFATFVERLNHERVVHKGLPSNQCYFCSKTFGCTPSLQKHLRLHSRERPFRCLKCGKDFRNLETHMARVCGGDERKREEARKRKREQERAFRAKLKYPCDHCDERFGEKRQLVRHKKRVHLI